MYYHNRLIENQIAENLENYGAIDIIGPRMSGKTTTTEKVAGSILNLDDKKERNNGLKLSLVDSKLLLKGDSPRLIDEWEYIPELWDLAITNINQTHDNGLFILTSSIRGDNSNIMHSGAGRIKQLMMMPMSLYESRESNGSIRLIDLFNNKNIFIDDVSSTLSMPELIYAACRGGWPKSINSNDPLSTTHEIIEGICNSERLRSILIAYAQNISKLTSEEDILKSSQDNFKKISQPTYYSYVKSLKDNFIISNISSWRPSVRTPSAIRKTPRKNFIDPSIAVDLLKFTPESLLYDLEKFSDIFKSLCYRDLSIYSYTYGGKVTYFEDRYGLKVDCVLHLNDGRYGLINFMLTGDEEKRQSKSLLKLEKLINKNNMEKPSFKCIISGGNRAYTRDNNIKVIPISVLR